MGYVSSLEGIHFSSRYFLYDFHPCVGCQQKLDAPGRARHGARCGGDYWCPDVLSNRTCLSGWEFGLTKKRMDAIAWIQVWLVLISDFVLFFWWPILQLFLWKKPSLHQIGGVRWLARLPVTLNVKNSSRRRSWFCCLFQEQVVVGHDIDRWRAMIFHCTEVVKRDSWQPAFWFHFLV